MNIRKLLQVSWTQRMCKKYYESVEWDTKNYQSWKGRIDSTNLIFLVMKWTSQAKQRYSNKLKNRKIQAPYHRIRRKIESKIIFPHKILTVFTLFSTALKQYFEKKVVVLNSISLTTILNQNKCLIKET